MTEDEMIEVLRKRLVIDLRTTYFDYHTKVTASLVLVSADGKDREVISTDYIQINEAD